MQNNLSSYLSCFLNMLQCEIKIFIKHKDTIIEIKILIILIMSNGEVDGLLLPKSEV